MKYRVAAIIGPSGCGKTSILNALMKKDKKNKYHQIVSYTSRPKREGEVEGKDYHFLPTTHEAAIDFIIDKDTVEASTFNNWVYGTKYDSYDADKINIGIFDVERLEALRSNENFDIEIFYILTQDRLRLIRQLQREDNVDIEEVIRRYYADKEDFLDLPFNLRYIKNNISSDFDMAVATIKLSLDKKI